MQPGYGHYGQDTDLTYRRPDYGYYWGEILYKLYPRLLALVQSGMQRKILFIFKINFPSSEPDRDWVELLLGHFNLVEV